MASISERRGFCVPGSTGRTPRNSVLARTPIVLDYAFVRRSRDKTKSAAPKEKTALYPASEMPNSRHCASSQRTICSGLKSSRHGTGSHQPAADQPEKDRRPMGPTLPDAHLAGRESPQILEGKSPQEQGSADRSGQKGRQGFGSPGQSLVFAAGRSH